MARNSLVPGDTYVEDLTEAKEPGLRSSLPAAATESYIRDTRQGWGLRVFPCAKGIDFPLHLLAL